ncbi:MAG: hypothetical protein ACXABO_20450 [Promethearchaeota archaeon]|jgi:hypothetical protein
MSENIDGLRDQINVAAYYLAQKNFTYDKLCYMLAERQLIAQRDPRYKDESRKREKAAEIYFSSTPYDILCWFISELDILIKLGKV